MFDGFGQPITLLEPEAILGESRPNFASAYLTAAAKRAHHARLPIQRTDDRRSLYRYPVLEDLTEFRRQFLT